MPAILRAVPDDERVQACVELWRSVHGSRPTVADISRVTGIPADRVEAAVLALAGVSPVNLAALIVSAAVAVGTLMMGYGSLQQRKRTKALERRVALHAKQLGLPVDD